MQIGLCMTEFAERASGAATSHWISWSSLWRGWLLALCITFALSTQLLFQIDLYNWPLASILLSWLDRFVDQLIVGACIFVCIALVALIPTKSTPVKHVLLLMGITLGAPAGQNMTFCAGHGGLASLEHQYCSR
jgi:hypothetical protein